MSYYKLIFVDKHGELDTCVFNRQPTTDDIAIAATSSEDFVLQRIGDWWEVYALSTLRMAPMGSCIGLPVFTHEDEDAAIAYAVLMAGRK